MTRVSFSTTSYTLALLVECSAVRSKIDAGHVVFATLLFAIGLLQARVYQRNWRGAKNSMFFRGSVIYYSNK